MKDEHIKTVYENKVSKARYNIKKMYTNEEVKENSLLNSLDIGEKDIAFEVVLQLLPADGVDPEELIIPNGEYDQDLGWVVSLERVGVLKYDESSESYTITNFGSGW